MRRERLAAILNEGWRVRLLLGGALLPIISACSVTPKDESHEGPCVSDLDCVGDWICNQATRTCIPEANCTDEDGDHYCGDSDCDDDPTTGTDCHTGCQVFYADNDGDEHGNRIARRLACVPPDSGYVDNDNDCDDTSSTGAQCSMGCGTYYADSDRDGYGNPGNSVLRCALSDGYVADNTDCDDEESRCSTDCSTDDDDDDTPDCGDTCVDVDGDTYGDGTNGNTGCAQATTDCNDEESLCSTDCATDNDNDDTPDCEDFCVDQDGDTYGNGTNGNTGCAQATTDCDDSDADEKPGRVWYPDADGDTYGDSGAGGNECERTSSSDVLDHTDCDDDNENCTTDCTDDDGDGYCASHDCDESLYACNNPDFCDDDDSDGVNDCIELACNTLPDDINDTCIVLDGVSALPDSKIATLVNGISYADGTTGVVEKLYLTYSLSQAGSLYIDDTLELRAEPGAVITNTNDDDSVFNVRNTAQGCVLEGLTITGGMDVFRVFGDSTEIRNCEVNGWTDGAAISVGAYDTLIAGNFLHNSTAGVNTRRTGIRVEIDGWGTRIVDNLIVNNQTHGIVQRPDAGELVIDHNTIANNDGAGVVILVGTSNLCMRNNIIANNDSYAFVLPGTTNFEITNCEAPLTDGGYGNVVFGNNSGGDQCGGTCNEGDDCTECMSAYFTVSNFLEFRENPGFDGNYCLGNTGLIDVCDDLSYDLNGADAGLYNGTSPEPGAQEAGSGGCSIP